MLALRNVMGCALMTLAYSSASPRLRLHGELGKLKFVASRVAKSSFPCLHLQCLMYSDQEVISVQECMKRHPFVSRPPLVAIALRWRSSMG